MRAANGARARRIRGAQLLVDKRPRFGHRHEHSQYRRRRVFSKAGQSLAVLVVNVLSRLLKRGK